MRVVILGKGPVSRTLSDPAVRQQMARHDIVLLDRLTVAPDSPAVRLVFADQSKAPVEQPVRSGSLPVDTIAVLDAPSRQATVAWLRSLPLADGPAHLEVREPGCPGGLPGVTTDTRSTQPRFIVLVGADAQTEADASPAAARLEAMALRNGEAAGSGMLLAADGLKSTRQATRVKVDAARRLSVMDGPFAEAKELVAGFWLIQAATLDAAVAWARAYPFAQDRPNVCVGPVLP